MHGWQRLSRTTIDQPTRASRLQRRTFPLFLELTGGGAGLDGSETGSHGPSVDINARRAVRGDPIVVTLIPEVADKSYALDHVKRAVDWCLEHLPQIDRSKVVLWGASGGGTRVWQYAQEYDMSNGVTHGIALNAPVNPVNVTNKFSMPINMISDSKDGRLYTHLVGIYLLKANAENMRVTILEGFDTLPDEILQSRVGGL